MCARANGYSFSGDVRWGGSVPSSIKESQVTRNKNFNSYVGWHIIVYICVACFVSLF
jgi:hypothetical protein